MNHLKSKKENLRQIITIGYFQEIAQEGDLEKKWQNHLNSQNAFKFDLPNNFTRMILYFFS